MHILVIDCFTDVSLHCCSIQAFSSRYRSHKWAKTVFRWTGTCYFILPFLYSIAGTLDVIIKILKLEGVVGLYQGLESKLLQSVLNASFLFLLHHKFVSVLVRIISERKIKPSSHWGYRPHIHSKTRLSAAFSRRAPCSRAVIVATIH